MFHGCASFTFHSPKNLSMVSAGAQFKKRTLLQKYIVLLTSVK